MVSKLILATLAVLGAGAGFALAGPPRANAPSLSSALEVSQLYHREVAMTAQESHLQQLLGFARAELARPAAPTAAPQAVLVASPAPAPSKPAAAAPSPSRPVSTTVPVAAPVATTTTEPPPPTTTTEPPPTTTTTTTPPTTTTTRPRDGGDGGGGDD